MNIAFDVEIIDLRDTQQQVRARGEVVGFVRNKSGWELCEK